MYAFLYKLASKHMKKRTEMTGSNSALTQYYRGRLVMTFEDFAPRGHEVTVGFVINKSDNIVGG